MRSIIIDKRFTDVSNVKAIVHLGYFPRLSFLVDLLWEDVKIESKRLSKRAQNRDRYFHLGYYPGDCVKLVIGEYKDFIATYRIFELLRQDERYKKTALGLFNSTAMRCLGMLNIIRTNDHHLVLGVRSQKVQVAPSTLCFPSGGVMPEYTKEVLGKADLYSSAIIQIKDELGIDVPRKDLSLYGITRDDYASPNSALAFGTDVPLDSKEVVEAYRTAKDRYEHDKLVLVREDEFYDRLFRKELDLIGFCIGGMFLRDRLDSDKYRKELASLNFQIVES